MVIFFNKKYFTAAIILFTIEVFIALYVTDAFVRPYGGDFLIVFFLYCFIKSFLKIPFKDAIFGVLLFSWTLEVLQYLEIVRLLGWEQNKVLSTVLGNHFEWLDMLIYTLAALILLWIENLRRKYFLKKAT